MWLAKGLSAHNMLVWWGRLSLLFFSDSGLFRLRFLVYLESGITLLCMFYAKNYIRKTRRFLGTIFYRFTTPWTDPQLVQKITKTSFLEPSAATFNL